MSDERLDPQQEESGHRWVVPTALGLSAFGLLLTASTAFMEHTFWLSSVLVNLGTTLVLTFPLALLGHFLTERIKKSQEATESQISSVRDDVEGVQSELDDFRETTSKTIAELQDNYDQSVAAKLSQRATDIQNLRSNPSIDLLGSTVAEEMRLGKISPKGFIVKYHGDRLFCSFEQDAWSLQGVGIRVFEYGSSLQDAGASVSLRSADSLEELFTRLNYDLAAANLLDPRDFDISQFFTELTDSLDAIDECRKLHDSIDLGPALIVPNDGWMLTGTALVSRNSRYPPLWFTRKYVQDEGLLQHLREKPWVDYDELWEATSWAWHLALVSEAWYNGKLK